MALRIQSRRQAVRDDVAQASERLEAGAIPVDARSLEMRGARGHHQPRRQLFELLPGLQEAKGATTISLPKAEKEGRS